MPDLIAGEARSPPGAGGAGPGPRGGEGAAEPPRSGMYIGRLSDSTSPPSPPRERADPPSEVGEAPLPCPALPPAPGQGSGRCRERGAWGRRGAGSSLAHPTLGGLSPGLRGGGVPGFPICCGGAKLVLEPVWGGGELPTPFGDTPLPAPHCWGLLPGPPAPCFAHFFPYWSLAQAWDAEGVALFLFAQDRRGWGGPVPSL